MLQEIGPLFFKYQIVNLMTRLVLRNQNQMITIYSLAKYKNNVN